MQEALICRDAFRTWWEQLSRMDLAHACTPFISTDVDMIPLRAFVRATEALAAESGQASLGWTVGQTKDRRALGPLGDTVMGSTTLSLALRRLEAYFAVVQDAAELVVRREDGTCAVSYRILDPDIWPRHQDALFTLSLICQLLHRATTALTGKIEILLETSDPVQLSDLARRTGILCSGGHETNMLRFPVAWLDHPLRQDDVRPTSDCSGLNHSIVQRRRAIGIELRVRSLIYQHLGVRTIDQERIATQLGMSSRTLRRRLADTQLSFQQIVDDCRMRQAAHEFCRRGAVSIAQTALRLGYSEHSTFTRAFSRWSGMPPQQFIRTAGRHGLPVYAATRLAS